MFNRRRFIITSATGLIGTVTFTRTVFAGKPNNSQLISKTIPSTGERLPVIGMGTWQTFNVGTDRQIRDKRLEVLKLFFELGGGMIDCSPMYGSSADVLGYGLERISVPEGLFSADKVWTGNSGATEQETEAQAQRWHLQKLDLVQVHNLLSWQDHLKNLREMKQQGKIRYLGVTTSHGRRHRELESILASEELDFVQLTYNISDRDAEQRLLPLAQEHGIAVIANRPYGGGTLIRTLQRKAKIPEWANKELGYRNWADLLLGFIVSHPAINCAIPATTKTAHMRENMQAGNLPLIEQKQRSRLAKLVQSI